YTCCFRYLYHINLNIIKMKKSIKQITTIVLIAFTTFSFTTKNEEKKEINVETSKVVWKGYKVTGSHEGTITIKSGHLNFNEDRLTGGAFVIDMLSITNTDLEGDYKGKLEGHLKSDDFFGRSEERRVGKECSYGRS